MKISYNICIVRIDEKKNDLEFRFYSSCRQQHIVSHSLLLLSTIYIYILYIHISFNSRSHTLEREKIY